MRTRITERLTWLGGVLDLTANAAGASRISAAGSRLAIHVVPTDEELMIARHTVALLSTARDP
jgi:acetate kinase